jgi:hypothetical protein
VQEFSFVLKSSGRTGIITCSDGQQSLDLECEMAAEFRRSANFNVTRQMSPPAWTEREAAFFARDGALRDVYIMNITPEIWASLCSGISEMATDVAFTLDGEASEIPTPWAKVFQLRETVSPLFTARVGSVHIAIYFFSEDEFECDFWPTNIDSEPDFHSLCRLMETLASIAGRDVLLTNENVKDRPFLICSTHENRFYYPS